MSESVCTRNIKRIAVLLFAILLSLMMTMMCLGGSLSFSDFLQRGKVYDFSQEILTRDSTTWKYDTENGYFWISAPKAAKNLLINKKEEAWKYLYVNVDSLSVPLLNVELIYYSSDGEKIYVQPAVLLLGENQIELNGELPFRKLVLLVHNSEGVCISMASMQVRKQLNKSNWPMAIGVGIVTFSAFILLCCLWKGSRKKRGVNRKKVDFPEFKEVFENSESVFEDKWRKKSRGEKTAWRRLAFSLFFLWCIAGNVMEWLTDTTLYRYHLLICALLLWFIGLTCVENAEKKRRWKCPGFYAWIFLWIGTIAADFFNGSQVHLQGIVMIFAGIFAISHWKRMQHPEFLVWDMLEALEITFFISNIYCLLLRPKYIAAQYNGIFRNPEENAMFAVVMLSVFFIEIDHMVRGQQYKKKVFWCIWGGTQSMYLIVEAGNSTGYAVTGILMFIFVLRMIRCWRKWLLWIMAKKWMILATTLLSVFLVLGFHIGIKAIPYKSGLEYENEIKQTNKSKQILNAVEAYQPGSTKGLIRTKEIETSLIQKNYIRRLNLYGHSGLLKVFNQKTQPYSGYLYMAHRYGIFILVPYILYQICMLYLGVECLKKKECMDEFQAARDISQLWILCITVVNLGFCFRGNSEILFGHPLWLCFYLSIGFAFADSYIKKKQEDI